MIIWKIITVGEYIDPGLLGLTLEEFISSEKSKPV